VTFLCFANFLILLVADGYLAAGYNYVNMDDCWQERQRSTDGKLVANRTRFPSGLEALAKYVCFVANGYEN
jgi:hypothetical protein